MHIYHFNFLFPFNYFFYCIHCIQYTVYTVYSILYTLYTYILNTLYWQISPKLFKALDFSPLIKLNGNPIKRVSKTDYLGLIINENLSSLYIYHFSTVVYFSSEKYRGSTGHRNSLNVEIEMLEILFLQLQMRFSLKHIDGM